VHSGHTSAVHVTARFGSASRGDPFYEAVVHLGRLLRTVFLCDYFLNDVFRRELLRVLNRGEAVNSLRRAIYTGRVASHQAKQPDEMQSVADTLSLLANIVMAWIAEGARSLGAASRRRDPTGAHWPHRTDPHGGYQSARRIPIPTRALRRPNPTVCSCQENDGGNRVSSQNRAGMLLFIGNQNSAQNQTLARPTRDAREIYLPATVCYCTENERTPLLVPLVVAPSRCRDQGRRRFVPRLAFLPVDAPSSFARAEVLR
jgi:hypothetical protein